MIIGLEMGMPLVALRKERFQCSDRGENLPKVGPRETEGEKLEMAGVCNNSRSFAEERNESVTREGGRPKRGFLRWKK